MYDHPNKTGDTSPPALTGKDIKVGGGNGKFSKNKISEIFFYMEWFYLAINV